MTTREAMQRAQRTYRQRLKADGLTQINVIVPIACAETIKRIAAELREDTAMGRRLEEILDGLPPERQQKVEERSQELTADAKVRALVLQARGWGWAPDAIANYAGVSVNEVERILRESGK